MRWAKKFLLGVAKLSFFPRSFVDLLLENHDLFSATFYAVKLLLFADIRNLFGCNFLKYQLVVQFIRNDYLLKMKAVILLTIVLVDSSMSCLPHSSLGYLARSKAMPKELPK